MLARTRVADERGASSVEYGLLVVAIAAVIAFVVFALGTMTKSELGAACNSIASQQQATSATC